MTDTVCLFLEVHCYLQGTAFEKSGACSVWFKPGKWDENDETYDYFTEEPGVTKIVGPIEPDKASECQKSLAARFTELGFRVQTETIPDD